MKINEVYFFIDHPELTGKERGSDSEWSQEVILRNGCRGRIYYYTSPEDYQRVVKLGGDWEKLNWNDKADRIEYAVGIEFEPDLVGEKTTLSITDSLMTARD